jgi:hypothetical protein
VLINGIPGHDIKDVELSHIKLYFKGSGTAEMAKAEVPELEKGYPEPGSFGTLPAYGIYARHVNGLKLEDIDMNFSNDDLRPAISLTSVQSVAIRFVMAQTNTNIPVTANNSIGVTLFQSLNLPDGELK